MRPLLVNSFLFRAFQQILGSQLNNPGTTWPETAFEITFSRHEDVSGNPIHLIAAVLALISLFLGARRNELSTKCYATFLLDCGRNVPYDKIIIQEVLPG